MINSRAVLLFFSFLGALPASAEMASQDTVGELSTELLIRHENTSGLPNGRNDLSRTRLFLWTDLEAPINESFSFGLSYRGNVGTDDESDNRRNLDNIPSNTGDWDQYFLDWNYSDDWYVRAGKFRLPVMLSSMLWDSKLAGKGALLKGEWFDDEDNQYLVVAGAIKVDHYLSENTKFSFAKFQFFTSLDSFDISSGLSAYRISETDNLISDNIVRQNSNAGLQSDFDIVLAEFSVTFGLFDKPFTVGVEAAENSGQDSANRAQRINMIVGDNSVEGGYQFNFHYQDIERNAVVAAFGDDDWWFNSWTTGSRVSTSYGLTESVVLQLSYFNEELLTVNTKRLFLELRSFW